MNRPGPHRPFGSPRRALVVAALAVSLVAVTAPAPAPTQPASAQPQPPVGEVQATPEVVDDGFGLTTLTPATSPTALRFGPGGPDGPDLYATTLAGTVQRYHLQWTPLGPVLEDTSVAATGFRLPLGLAFDDDGDLLVSDSDGEGDTADSEAAERPLGKVVHVDAATGERSTIVEGLPNGQHNTNQIRFGPDGLLYLPNGNPNDHGNQTDPDVDTESGTDHTDIFPYSGAFLAVDVDGVDPNLPDTTPASPAVLHWTNATGARIPDDDVVGHPLNEDFADKVHVLAHGFRNIFGIAFAPGDLPFADAPYTAMNGADDPSSQDTLFEIQPGADHGFPFCYDRGPQGGVGDAIVKEANPDTPDPSITDADCREKPAATATLGWHTCSTGLDFPTDGADGPTTQGPAGTGFDWSFPADHQRSVYVGECSVFFVNDWAERQLEDGYSTHSNSHKVARVALNETGEATEVRDFVKGLTLPTDVQFGPDGAMYVADAEGIHRVAPLPEPAEAGPDAAVPVVAAGQSFLPPLTVVAEGTTVRWIGGAISHTVTASDEPCVPHLAPGGCSPADGSPSFDALLDGAGDTAEHTFQEAGNQPYYCRFHYQLGMVGSVLVVDPDDPQATAEALDEARHALADARPEGHDVGHHHDATDAGVHPH